MGASLWKRGVPDGEFFSDRIVTQRGKILNAEPTNCFCDGALSVEKLLGKLVFKTIVNAFCLDQASDEADFLLSLKIS